MGLYFFPCHLWVSLLCRHFIWPLYIHINTNVELLSNGSGGYIPSPPPLSLFISVEISVRQRNLFFLDLTGGWSHWRRPPSPCLSLALPFLPIRLLFNHQRFTAVEPLWNAVWHVLRDVCQPGAKEKNDFYFLFHSLHLLPALPRRFYKKRGLMFQRHWLQTRAVPVSCTNRLCANKKRKIFFKKEKN